MSRGYKCTMRRPGERVFIGEGVEILISRVKGKQVVLAIKAPLSIEIKWPGKDQDRLDRADWAAYREKLSGEKQ